MRSVRESLRALASLFTLPPTLTGEPLQGGEAAIPITMLGGMVQKPMKPPPTLQAPHHIPTLRYRPHTSLTHLLPLSLIIPLYSGMCQEGHGECYNKPCDLC